MPSEVLNLGGELAPNSRPRIKTLSAFLLIDANGNEGIASFYNQQQKVWVPLVSQDQGQLEAMRGTAQAIATNTQTALTLAQFSAREDLEKVTP